MFYIKHNVCSFKCTCIIVTDTCNTAKPMNLTKSMLTHVIVAHVSLCNKYSTTCNAEKRFIRYEAFQNAFSFYSVEGYMHPWLLPKVGAYARKHTSVKRMSNTVIFTAKDFGISDVVLEFSCISELDLNRFFLDSGTKDLRPLIRRAGLISIRHWVWISLLKW